MLKRNTPRKANPQGGRYLIVAAQYNAEYVDGMLHAAEAELKRGGAESIRVLRVPGSFEVPVAIARWLASTGGTTDAIIALGVIIQGETAHAQHIGDAITHALMRLQLESGLPVVHEVLLVQNEGQAAARCLSKETNRGTEAARTAMEMAALFRGLPVE